MESKITTALSSRNVSDSSKELYLKNLKRLNDNNEIKNLNFLKETDKIFEKISKFKPNTQRTYFISVVACLKDVPRFKKVYKIYYDKMMELNEELKTLQKLQQFPSRFRVNQQRLVMFLDQHAAMIAQAQNRLGKS